MLNRNIIATSLLIIGICTQSVLATEITGRDANLLEAEVLEEMLKCNEALSRMPNAKPEKRILIVSGYFDKNADRPKPLFFCLYGNKRKLAKDEFKE